MPQRLVRRLLAGVAPATLLWTAGCAMTFDATSLGVPATMASSATAAPDGTPFRVTRTAVYLLWGALGVSRPSLENILAGQLVGADEIAQVRINVRSRFADVLLSVLTVGLVSTRAVTFEGVIVDR